MVRTSFDLVVDVLHLVVLGLRSHARLAAENLFLRKQLRYTSNVRCNRVAPPTRRV
jgi:hypothetical protein